MTKQSAKNPDAAPEESSAVQLEKKRRRGIYLLPNFFTTSCLFAGFFAIIMSMSDKYESAAIAIFIAMIMDGLDGRVARLTNTQTDFGAEYDSLADMVSFGLAPSLVMYQWALQSLGKLGWLAAFVYAAGTALRLARFNTQVGIAGKRYFQGLASPAAAALIAGMIWVGTGYEVNGNDWRVPAFLITLLAGILMVSNIRYRSFKDLDVRGRIPFVALVVVMLIFVFISIDPPNVLFAIFLLYALSGPTVTLLTLRKRRRERHLHFTQQDTPKPGENTSEISSENSSENKADSGANSEETKKSQEKHQP